MSTERVTHFTDLATGAAAAQIAARVGKQAAARACVDIRCVRAVGVAARSAARSTDTEAYPYSSFEQGGVRRFDRSPFARGPFEAGPDLPPFRVS